MSLALHILRKDIRHLFPEILLTLALTLAFAATAQWGGSIAYTFGISALGVIAPLLRILLPIAWLILIARLVHEESLVGDRQFWVSRPYPWPTLLLAKLLFVLAFLVVPFLLMQLYLLHHATFAIAPALPDLLLFQLRLAAIAFIPFVAIATVTSSFARQFLVALVALLYVVGCFAIGGQAMSHRFLASGILTTALILLTLANLAVILLQYARRRTRLARITLAALPAVLLAFILLAPILLAPARLLIERAFPSTAPSPQTTLLFDPDPARRQPDSNQPPLVFPDGYIILSLPVQIPGLLPGLRLKGKAISLTLDSPSGLHWTSPYQGVDADLSTRNARPSIDVAIPAAVFNRFKNTPADLRLSLAVDRSTTGVPRTVTANLPAFATPGRGLCLVTSLGITSNCLFPLRPPPPIDLSLQTSDQPCGSTTPATIRPQTTSTGSDDTFLRFDLDPIVTNPLHLWIDRERTGNIQPTYLCPGTPVTLTPHTVVGHQRLTLTKPAVVLAPYARHQMTRADGQPTITPQPQEMNPEPRNP